MSTYCNDCINTYDVEGKKKGKGSGGGETFRNHNGQTCSTYKQCVSFVITIFPLHLIAVKAVELEVLLWMFRTVSLRYLNLLPSLSQHHGRGSG